MSVPDPVITGLVTATALQVAKQAQDFIAAAAGHPGESIGTILGNWNRRRIDNVEAVGNKARLILLNLDVQPRALPLKVIQPLLEAASLEEDSGLQDVWANLLAYAADPRQTEVPPMFPLILKELGAPEVKFMERLVTGALERMSGAVHADTIDVTFSHEELVKAYANTGLIRAKVPMSSLKSDEEYWEHRADYLADANDFDMALEIVLRNRLLQGKLATNPDPPIPTGDAKAIEFVSMRYSFTYLGVAFLKACRGPALPPIFQSKGCFGNE